MLQTRGSGYALELPSEALDLDRFERLRREGRAALDAGDPAKASARFEAALELWRGPALAEFAEPFALVEAAHLRERLQVCVEDRIDADLALGRHADLVGELESLVVVEPAARAAARAADGRAVSLRPPSGRLVGLPGLPRHARVELGLEPSARMRELERRILRQDTDLDGAGGDVGRGRSSRWSRSATCRASAATRSPTR